MWHSALSFSSWFRTEETSKPWQLSRRSKSSADSFDGQQHGVILPEDLILYILSFSGCTELAKASCLSRRFRYVLYNTPSIWRSAFLNEYGQVSHRECQLLSSTDNWRTLSARRTRPRVNFRRGNAVVTPLHGHKSWVTGGALSWSHIITASRDSTLKVWDAEQGTQRATLQGHGALIRAVKANERVVVSGSSDRTLKLWNLRSGESATLGSHDASVACLDVNLRLQETVGGLVVSGAGDQMVRVWDMQTCQPVGVKSGSIGIVSCVRLLSPETQLVASGGADRVLRVFDLREPDHAPPQLSLFGHTRKIFNLEPLAADPNLLISESHPGQEVLVWDIRRPAEPLHRILRDDVITSFSLSDYASNQPGGVQSSTSVFQHQTDYLGPPQHHLNPNPRAPAMEAEAVVLGQAGDDAEEESGRRNKHGSRQLMSLGLRDGTVEVWDPVLGIQTHRSPLTGTRSPVTCTTLQSDGRLVAGHRDGRIAAWDIHTGANCWVYQPPNCGMPISMSMIESKLVVGTRSKIALLFDFNASLLSETDQPCSSQSTLSSIASFLSSSGSTYAWWNRLSSPFGSSSSGVPQGRVVLRGGHPSSVS